MASWDYIMLGLEEWFDKVVVPLLGDDKPSLAKVKEEYKELLDAESSYRYWQRRDDPWMEQARINRDGEVVDLFVALVLFAHNEGIDLKGALPEVMVKLRNRRWERIGPGLVRHVGDD